MCRWVGEWVFILFNSSFKESAGYKERKREGRMGWKSEEEVKMRGKGRILSLGEGVAVGVAYYREYVCNGVA